MYHCGDQRKAPLSQGLDATAVPKSRLIFSPETLSSTERDKGKGKSLVQHTGQSKASLIP